MIADGELSVRDFIAVTGKYARAEVKILDESFVIQFSLKLPPSFCRRLHKSALCPECNDTTG